MNDDQLIKTIDTIYYQESFDLQHLTDELPQNLTSEYLLDYKSKLERLLTVVSRKVSELILSHQPTYVSELQRIADLQKSLTESIRVCSHGRRCLGFVKEGTAKNGSTIVDHYRKREGLAKLLGSLTAIGDLKRSVVEIRALIDSQEDVPRAIQMCKDGKALLAPFSSKFNCLQDLGSKLDDTRSSTIELLKQKLSNMTKLHNGFSRDRLDEFIRCLRDIELIMLMGDEFCGFQSRNELHAYINAQVLNFFHSYHNSSLEELRMFLENESWEMLPIKKEFKLVQLKEFSFLRSKDTTSSLPEEANEELFDETSSQDNDGCGSEKTGDQNQDFILPLDRISLSSDSDLDFELGKEFIDEDEVAPPTSFRLTKSQGPILTNSSLNVLRLAGRYVQMMNVLSPISYEILKKIYELLDQYITFVHKKFGPNDDKELEALIISLKASLIGASSQSAANLESAKSMKANEPANSRKAIAIESLVFLVNQLWCLQEYLETLISAEQRSHLHEQFSSQNSSMVPDFLKARGELSEPPQPLPKPRNL